MQAKIKVRRPFFFIGLLSLCGAAANALCSDLLQTVFGGQGKVFKGIVQTLVKAVDGGGKFGAEALPPGGGLLR